MSLLNSSQSLTPRLLDVIIPTYKRPEGVLVAAFSVLGQIKRYHLGSFVGVTIWDDCSPDLDISSIDNALSEFKGLYRLGRNSFNHGMSLNIYSLVASVKSVFCTILTDDDWLEDGSLPDVLEEISKIQSISLADGKDSIGAFFIPRYSYLEDGSLHCIECRLSNYDELIHKGPINAIKYCKNAFILTGLFFRPSIIDFDFWLENHDNCFFPLLYYSSIAFSNKVCFLDRKWQHHTCLNICHWEAWGADELERRSRLHLDYLRALILISRKYPATSLVDRVLHALCLSQAFQREFACFNAPFCNHFLIALTLASQSIVLVFSYAFFFARRFISGLQSKPCFLHRA